VVRLRGGREPGPARSSGERGVESIRRNTLFALGIQLSGAVFTGGLTIFLVRVLGPTDYGIFALAFSIGAMVLLPSDLGVSQSAARFIAERRGDPEGISRVLGDAISLKLLGSGLVSAALVAAAGPIASAYDVPELEGALRIIALATFGQSFMFLFMASFAALARSSIGFRLAFSESAVEATASVTFVLLGAGITGAVWGRAVGFCFGGLAGFLLLHRLLGGGRFRPTTRPGEGIRQVARYAGALFVIDGAYSLFSQIDTLLIGAILNAREAGEFAAPFRLMTIVQLPGLAVADGVAPRMARGGAEPPNVAALQGAIRYLLLLQFAAVAPAIFLAEPLVELLLGSDYGDSVAVIQALAPYVLVTGLIPLVSLAVNYLGEARRRVPLAVAAVVINTLLDIALIPQIGIVAAAIGTDVASVVYLGGHIWICHDIVGLNLRALGVSLLRATLAAGVMAATLGAATVLLPGLALLASLPAGLIAYVGALLLVREVSRAELEAAPRALRGLLVRS